MKKLGINTINRFQHSKSVKEKYRRIMETRHSSRFIHTKQNRLMEKWNKIHQDLIKISHEGDKQCIMQVID